MKKILLIILCLSALNLCQAQNFKTVRIGNQTWMAENLNVSVPGSYCYNDDPSMGKKYGRLYTWEAAQKACPPGWRIPTENDWNQLIASLGGEENAGKKLKVGGSSGFNAPLGGMSSVGNYLMINSYGTFWSSSNYDKEHAWYFYLTSTSNSVTKTYFSKTYAFSVRCIKQ